MFKWKKLGLIFDLQKNETPEWMKEQAQNPYAVEMDAHVRVYFNCRKKRDSDGKSMSYAGFVDLDKNDLTKILNIAKEPLLQHGSKGSFDEFGVMAGSVIQVENEYYLYYCGWTRMQSVPYNWAVGLAKSKNNGTTFERYGMGPILGSTYNEPYLQAGCSSIIKIEDTYHLWYTSGIKWIDTDSKSESVYQIMHATSSDAIHWQRNGVPIIKPVVEDEAQASPSVIKINNRWHMFYSYRHSVNFRNKERGYRLGYAWSDDLRIWNRDDSQVGLNVSETGWDSEMVCYPSVFQMNGSTYLFYCGNDFGKEGFGIALLEK